MDIAVIGLSGIYPGADNLETLHNNLANRVDSVCTVPQSRRELLGLEPDIEYQEIGFLEHIEHFDHGFFHISSREADQMSPEQRIALEMAAKAVLDSGYSLEAFRGTNCGVFVASQDQDYYSMLKEKSGLAWIGSLKSMLAGKISYHLDLHGPNMVIDTGCSSGMVCIEDACRRLERGEIDYALVGGVTIYLKFGTKNTDGDLLGIEAGNGRCKPFDASADGIGVGEGGGFLLLKRREEAKRDHDHIYGVVKACAINGDGARCSSITTPGIEGQKEAILHAWKEAGIHPEDITEVEAHGTGTKLGDPIEVESFHESCLEYGELIKKKPIYLGSIKGNVGHLNATAAIASVTKILLGFQNHVIYPLCHYKTPNPLIDFTSTLLEPSAKLIHMDISAKRLACANSFGLSGTNVHILIENWTGKEESHPVSDHILLKVSARTEQAFYQYRKELEHYFSNQVLTKEILATLNVGRDDYQYRKVVLANTYDEFLEELKRVEPEKADEPKVALVIRKATTDAESILSKEQKSEQWKLYQRLQALGVTGEYVLVDSYGRMILEHQEDDVWPEWENDGFKTEEISEERIGKKLEELSQSQKLEVIWIGDYEGSLNGNVCVHWLQTEEDLLELVKLLYERGLDINWSGLDSCHYQKVSAPTYCFDKNYHWSEMLGDVAAHNEERKGGKPCTGEDSQKTENLVDASAKNNPFTQIEEQLKKMWVTVLECEESEVEADTDFFDLGGNSLMITLLVEEIAKTFGVELSVEDIYDYYTIAMQKEAIEELLKEQGGVFDTNQNEIQQQEELQYEETKVQKNNAALTGKTQLIPMQQLIWNAIDRHSERSEWNLTLTFKVEGAMELERMKKAYYGVCQNHDLLRSHLVKENGMVYLAVEQGMDQNFKVMDLHAKENPEQKALELMKKEALTPVDMSGALSGLTIYHIGKEVNYLLFKISHLIADGWSLNIIFEELCSGYSTGIWDKEEKKKYAEYASYERSQTSSTDIVEDDIIRILEHPQLAPKYAPESHVVSLEYIMVHGKLLEQLRYYVRNKKSSLFQIVLTIYHMTIQSFLQTDESRIGVMLGNRSNQDYGNTVGLFAKTILSKVKKEMSDKPEDLLRKVRQESNEMLAKNQPGIGIFAEQRAGTAFDDVVEFLLTYQNFKNSDIVMEGLQFSAHMIREIEAICPMTILFYDTPQAMVGTIQYNPIYFRKDDVKQFSQLFLDNIQVLLKEEV